MSDNTEAASLSQYLTFTLGDEGYALEIFKVKEILDYTTITKVPGVPDFISGVINLRGNVVPIVDLRLKLGMKSCERTVNTCIVIVDIELDGEPAIMGALADSVEEVIDLDKTQIEPPPKFGSKLKTGFIKGMGKKDETFLIILDIDKIFSSEEFAMIKDTEEAQVKEVITET